MLENINNPTKFKEDIHKILDDMVAEGFKKFVVRGGQKIKKEFSRSDAEKAKRSGQSKSKRKLVAAKRGRQLKSLKTLKKSPAKLSRKKSERKRRSSGLK